MNFTPVTDSFGRSVQISSEKFSSTYFAGLFPIGHIVNRLGLFDAADKIFAKDFDVKANTKHTPQTLFHQRMYALMAGFEDLNDHDVITSDPGFKAIVGCDDLAGSSTLCRFENSINRHSIDRLNTSLLEAVAAANKRLNFLPSRGDVMILDFDSTHIDLYGNQEGKSYNAHYATNCLAPVLCFLDGWPIAVFNAHGTKDARTVLVKQIVRLVRRIKKAFPNRYLLLRGDSGFNSTKLIETCEAENIFYVTGLSPNKTARNYALGQLADKTQKRVKRYTARGHGVRTLGEIVGYKAKSWTQNRRVIARNQYTSDYQQLDIRLIQTNIKQCKSYEPGFCGRFSKMNAEKMYEQLYCQRALCEQNIEEFKSECFGSRASAQRFHTNSYRMILAMYCLLAMKLTRRVALTGYRVGKKKAEITIRKMRRDLIVVTAQYVATPSVIELKLPSMLLNPEAFMSLFNVPKF